MAVRNKTELPTPVFIRHWWDDFTERERQEITFAETYAATFNHGTDGHNRLNLISLMAKELDNKQIETEKK